MTILHTLCGLGFELQGVQVLLFFIVYSHFIEEELLPPLPEDVPLQVRNQV